MANYEGENCCKCGKPFEAGDDIVVCPDCGAPYHRKCAKDMEQCVYAEKHGTDEAYKPKEERDKERMEAEKRKVDGRGELRCSRCGTLNGSNGLFCEVCGTPLQKQIEQQYQEVYRGQSEGEEAREPRERKNDEIPPFRSIPYNPYTTPFGGLNPDEEIDGISVKELAIFLGQNSHYFLPRFKQMKEKNSNTWNWSAMIMSYYYLLFRKITWLGVLILLATIILSVPAMLANYDDFLHVYSPDTPSVFNEDFLFMMASVFNLLSIGIRVFLGMFVNRIYMNQVFRKIRQLKEKYGESGEYHSMLVKHGTVSVAWAVAVAVATVMINFIMVFVMMAMMV